MAYEIDKDVTLFSGGDCEYKLVNEILPEPTPGRPTGVNVALRDINLIISKDRRNRMRKAFLGLPRQELDALKAMAVERGEPLARAEIQRTTDAIRKAAAKRAAVDLPIPLAPPVTRAT